MGLQKAKILVLNNRDLSKTLYEIPILFNPESYSITNGASLQGERQSKNTKTKNASSKDNTSVVMNISRRTLSFTLFYDTYNLNQKKDGYKSVRSYTKLITDLINHPVGCTDKTTNRVLNICQFSWGEFIFTGVFTSIDEKYEMFTNDGIPVRASLTVKMTEYVDNVSDVKEVVEIDNSLLENLSSMAALQYNDPTKWREIAKVNGINNPRPQSV